MDNKTLETSLPRNLNSPTSATTDSTVESLRVVKIVFFCVISIVGIVGNVIICKELIRRTRKLSEYFIINLAVADLSACAIGIPLDVYDELHDTWQYGSFLCKIIYPYQTLLMLVSIMTLTSMSLERHRAIMTPFKPRLKKSDLLKAIACVWIIGLCVVAPYPNFLAYDGKICDETWPNGTGAYYTLALFIIDYCIPLTIITICYTRAGWKLYENTKQFRNMNASLEISNFAQQKRLQHNKRIIKLFSFAVLMFCVCMLPGDCYWMWKSFGNGSAFAYEDHFKTFSNILVYANSAINPFIFGACRFGCLVTTRSPNNGRPRRHRILSFQSQESNSQLPQINMKKKKKNAEITDLNLNLVDLKNLKESDV